MIMPTMGLCVDRPVGRLFGWLRRPRATREQTAAGASQRSTMDVVTCLVRVPKIRSLSLADARRGFQERKCISNEFISFIRCSIETESDFLQAIAIPACGGIG